MNRFGDLTAYAVIFYRVAYVFVQGFQYDVRYLSKYISFIFNYNIKIKYVNILLKMIALQTLHKKPVFFEWPKLYEPKPDARRAVTSCERLLYDYPDDLFIVFNLLFEHAPLEIKPSKISWDPIIDFIKLNYKDIQNIHFMLGDVSHGSDFSTFYQTEKLPLLIDYPEYIFYSHLKVQFPDIPIKWYHFHDIPFFDTSYADVFLHDFLYRFTDIKKDAKFHTGTMINFQGENFSIAKKLSCINNLDRIERSYLTVLFDNFDIELTHLSKLNRHIPKPKFSPRIKHIYNTNFENTAKRFSKDQYNYNINHEPKQIIDSLNLIQNSFCNIVIEDPFWSYGGRITEKTAKAIISHRPFVLAGSIGTLDWLRRHGFKTFNKWWSEYYDVELDHWRRLEEIYKVAEYINSLSLSDCRQMLKDMKPTIAHNYENLVKNFAPKTLGNLTKR